MDERDEFDSPVLHKKDRRSGIERRWIKAPYKGKERRSGNNRRTGADLKNPLLPLAKTPFNATEVEKLLVAATLQLEAVTRLLLKSGVIDREELEAILADIRQEYEAADDG